MVECQSYAHHYHYHYQPRKLQQQKQGLCNIICVPVIVSNKQHRKGVVPCCWLAVMPHSSSLVTHFDSTLLMCTFHPFPFSLAPSRSHSHCCCLSSPSLALAPPNTCPIAAINKLPTCISINLLGCGWISLNSFGN